MSDRLRPCPFCGETRKIKHEPNLSAGSELWAIHCEVCDSWGPWGDGKSGGARAWNQRDGEQSVVDSMSIRRKAL